MRAHKLALVAFLVAALPSVLALSPDARAGGRTALVVGMGGYRYAPPLKNPTNDSRDISESLRELGFDVVEVADAGRRELEAAIRDFAGRIVASDTALLFYSGHGLQVAGQNYLIPVDARLVSIRDLEFEAVRLDLILALMESGRDNGVSIVMLDACRDNPLARSLARSMGVRSDALPRGLAPVQSSAGTFVAFSTAPGKVAYDGDGRNSPFATALLHHIRTPGKSLNSIMVDVRKEVMSVTHNAQVPWDLSALTVEFQFRPVDGLVTGSLTSRPPGPLDAARKERARRLREELGIPATGDGP